MPGLLSKGQRKYLEGGYIKKGPDRERQLRYRIRNKAKKGFKDYELLAKYLDAEDHKDVFTMDTFDPLFKALFDYGVKHEENKGPIKNVRLFKMFISLSNLCLNGCRALFSQDFEKLMIGGSLGVGFPSKEDLDYIQIAYNAILFNERTPAEKKHKSN